MSNLINNFIKEPYINVICVELGIDYEEYKRKRLIYIVIGIISMVAIITLGIVLKKLYLLILSIFVMYLFYRLAYIRVKILEQKIKVELFNLYPVFVQTFISLLYTNDNLIKVFLILEHYDFHPVINRQIIILINKYQQNPENAQLIFGEFCLIFNTSSASLLHQLMVNVSAQGINESEIVMIENKINQDYRDYIDKVAEQEVRQIYQYGYISIVIILGICLGLVITAV